MCAEGLSALIKKYECMKWIQEIKVFRQAPLVSHMLIVDDTYLYCRASVDEAMKVLELHRKFEDASG